MGLATSAGQACVARNTARAVAAENAHIANNQQYQTQLCIANGGGGWVPAGQDCWLLVCRAIWRVCYIGVRTDCVFRFQRNFCDSPRGRCGSCSRGGRGAAQFSEFDRMRAHPNSRSVTSG